MLVAFFVAGAAAQQGHFDLQTAQTLIIFADAAYCGDDQHGSSAPIADWSCAPCRNISGVTVHGIMSNKARQTLGFTALGPDGSIVASFRGSVLNKNYADDFDQALAPWWTPGHVHRGLHGSYLSLQQNFMKQMHELTTRYPNAPVHITGHSMGAAQAVYAAVDFAANFTRSNVTLISFGTPRPGDAAFVQYVKSLPNLAAWPVAHRADTVPQCGIYSAPCNERELGYRQISTNIWFPEDLAAPAMGPLEFVTWWVVAMLRPAH